MRRRCTVRRRSAPARLRRAGVGRAEGASVCGNGTPERIDPWLRDGRGERRSGLGPTCRRRRRPRHGRAGAGHGHRGNPHHGSLELARNAGSARHRAGPHRTRRTGAGGRRTRGRCRRGDRLIHHQHRSLELRRRGTLEVKVAFRARLRGIRVLRATVRTEHSSTSLGRTRPRRAAKSSCTERPEARKAARPVSIAVGDRAAQGILALAPGPGGGRPARMRSQASPLAIAPAKARRHDHRLTHVHGPN